MKGQDVQKDDRFRVGDRGGGSPDVGAERTLYTFEKTRSPCY